MGLSNRKKYLLVIGGATATGKTDLAIHLARHFNTDILSADSRQFYQEMDIGTAKPSPQQLEQATHHFINSLPIGQDYSVGDYEKDAIALLDQLFKQKDVAVLVGGSGLYIKAVCEGLDEFPDIPTDYRVEIENTYKTSGITALQRELELSDPVYFKQVDLNNPQRLMRALAVCRATGQPFSGFQRKGEAVRPFEPIYILLDIERAQLYERINQRVDAMMAAGLLREAERMYPHRNLNALKTVGYQELFDYLEGKASLENAVELIKQNSRRYAKRQMTWFRKHAEWQRFHPSQSEAILDFAAKKIGQ